MTYRDIIDTATEYGAKVRRDFHNPSWQCWADRVACIPIAQDKAKAIDEANRYAC